MDAKKFGAFIAENRKSKGMTQADLAQKIYVTDKAISRWERGIGFPDIQTIEPLASALGLSIFEIMKSQKIENNNDNDNMKEVIRSVVEMERENRKQERTAIGLTIFTIIITAILFYLTGKGNIGGSLFFGSIVAVDEVAIYYFLENKEDRESQKISSIIAICALLIIIFILLV